MPLVIKSFNKHHTNEVKRSAIELKNASVSHSTTRAQFKREIVRLWTQKMDGS
jgi:hypothetical protein